METKEYKDIYGDIFTVDKELGRGGQGVVYRVKDNDCAVKVRINSNGEEIKIKNGDKLPDPLYAKIQNILRLPIRDINEIALPAQILKEYSGYIMPLLSEMQEIKNLLELKKDKEIPEWLSNINNSEAAALFTNYFDTGSLKRRIELLMKVAAVLMQLHNRGLVYGDISLNNIFYSVDDKVYVCFIDADNIIFNDKVGGAVYTPKYGAPELVLHKGSNSILSDCFSFAVAAFHILSYSHPFEGEKTENNDNTDWADSDYNSNDKQSGNLYSNPWIYNEDDDSNHAVSGLPLELIVDDKLHFLFNKMFTEGVNNLATRPVMAEFYYAFIKAYNKIITCNHCGMTYYYDKFNGVCPYCDKENKNIITVKTVHKKTGKEISCFYESYSIGQPVNIPYSAFMDYEVKNIYEDALIINVENEYMEIQFLNNHFNFSGKKRMKENFYNKLENKSKTIRFEISIAR